MANQPGSSMLNRIVVAARKFLRLERQRAAQAVVVCPASRMPASVLLGDGDETLACSRRPEGEACAELCASQLLYTTENLEQFLISRGGMACAECGERIGASDWYSSRLEGNERTAHSGTALPSPKSVTCFRCWKAKTGSWQTDASSG